MAIQADPTEEDLTQENERPQEQGLGTTSLVVLGALRPHGNQAEGAGRWSVNNVDLILMRIYGTSSSPSLSLSLSAWRIKLDSLLIAE